MGERLTRQEFEIALSKTKRIKRSRHSGLFAEIYDPVSG
jgi:hypothetical protein